VGNQAYRSFQSVDENFHQIESVTVEWELVVQYIVAELRNSGRIMMEPNSGIDAQVQSIQHTWKLFGRGVAEKMRAFNGTQAQLGDAMGLVSRWQARRFQIEKDQS